MTVTNSTVVDSRRRNILILDKRQGLLFRHLICVLTFQILTVPGIHAGVECEQQAVARESARRPVTVADAIEMTRLGDPDYYAGASSRGKVARFSSDGSKFVVVLRRGNLDNNTNEYSLLLWHTARLPAPPEILLNISSSSNRPAIEDITWLEDGETIVFLATPSGEKHQVYTFSIKTHRLKQITRHPTDILTYSMTPKGDRVAYFAAEPTRQILDEQSDREGLLITNQSLDELLTDRMGGGGEKRGEVPQQLFFQLTSAKSRRREVAGGY